MSVANIVEKAENCKFVIYGTGVYSGVLYAYLDLLGLKDNLQFFVVTKKDKDEFMGREVKEIADIENQLNEFVTFVAIKNAKDILEQCGTTGAQIIHVGEKQIDEIRQRIYEFCCKLPMVNNRIFFDCFEGSGYKCNSKYIAEKLLDLGADCELVWNLNDMNETMPESVIKVKRNTCEYYKMLYTSKVVVGNDGVEGAPFKREGQFHINTWHGTGPFKKVNASVAGISDERKEQIKRIYSIVDLMVSNSQDNSVMYREAFLYEGEILEQGNPRIDYIFRDVNIQELRDKIGIPEDKKVLLYAPTFRDAGEKSFAQYDIDVNRVLEALNSRFGGEYILLYRFHHQLYKFGSRCNDYYPGAINVTFYLDVMELLKVTDVLITDYSAIMWDFSLQRRPVFLYQNDEDQYDNDRGFYWPPCEWPYAAAHSNDDLVRIIKDYDEEEYQRRLDDFWIRDPSYDRGSASEVVVDRIMKVINC